MALNSSRGHADGRHRHLVGALRGSLKVARLDLTLKREGNSILLDSFRWTQFFVRQFKSPHARCYYARLMYFTFLTPSSSHGLLIYQGYILE
jgi:hypothetical protein